MALKKLIALLVASLTFTFLPSAFADSVIFNSYSREDRVQPADMNYRYEPMSMSVEIMDSNKVELIIKVNFASSLNPNYFMSYSGATPLLRVKIMNDLEAYNTDAGYIWLEAPNNMAYQGSTKLDAISSIYTDPKKGVSGGRSSLAFCKPKTWMADGATSTWVAFSIDRNCADIDDLFWVTAFIDSNIYASSYFFDSKWVPKEPLTVNTQNVPRPIKMKEQVVTFASAIGTQSMDNPIARTTLTSSLQQPVAVYSVTPTICTPTASGLSVTVALLKSGTCSIEALAKGTDTINPSPKVSLTFAISPKITYNQSFSWDEPYEAYVGDAPINLYITTTSGLPMVITSTNPSVCQFRDATRPGVVTIINSGQCSINVRQDGNDKFNPASTSYSFWIDPKPVIEPTPTATPRPTYTSKPKAKPAPKAAKTTKTITCVGGKSIVKVTNAAPACPKGYKPG